MVQSFSSVNIQLVTVVVGVNLDESVYGEIFRMKDNDCKELTGGKDIWTGLVRGPGSISIGLNEVQTSERFDRFILEHSVGSFSEKAEMEFQGLLFSVNIKRSFYRVGELGYQVYISYCPKIQI